MKCVQLVLLAALSTCAVASDGDGDQCWSSHVKSVIKIRDEAQLGPLPASLTGTKRIEELLKNGVPTGLLGPSVSEGERVAMHIICKCEVPARLAADGYYKAGKLGLREVTCKGNLPASLVPYYVEEQGTCFVATVRASQRNRAVVSTFFLDAAEPGDGESRASATHKGRKSGRVFKKGQFKLGLYGYYDVCNQDQPESSGSQPSDKSVLRAAAPAPLAPAYYY